MNVYVICTPLDLRDVEKALYDTKSTVLLPQECLRSLQLINHAPMVVAITPDPDRERWNVDPVAHETITFEDLNLDECPACGHKLLPQEDWMFGYCNQCGFSWDQNHMWFEDYVHDEHNNGE